MNLFSNSGLNHKWNLVQSVYIFWGTAALRTSEDVVLVVLVRLRPHLDETVQPIVVDKLVDQVLVILQPNQPHFTVNSNLAKENTNGAP